MTPALAPALSRRTLEQLINTDEPGITLVRSWVAGAKNRVEILPVDRSAGERALVSLQITSRSPMGAIALETGGLLIDHGWLRVLGSGHLRLPRTIDDWNGLGPGGDGQRLPGAVLVADDAVGGFFALNGGGIPGSTGHIFYLSPMTLTWGDVAPSYSDWLLEMLSGDLGAFYEGMRWTGWEQAASDLRGDRAFSIHPFLFTEGPDVAERKKRPVPIEVLWHFYVEDVL